MSLPSRIAFGVSGRVQGVGYRYSAEREARRLGLSGWIRNREDGEVEGVVQGNPPAVEEFLRWCAAGPAGARVDSVRRATDPSPEVLSFFAIRR